MAERKQTKEQIALEKAMQPTKTNPLLSDKERADIATTFRKAGVTNAAAPFPDTTVAEEMGILLDRADDMKKTPTQKAALENQIRQLFKDHPGTEKVAETIMNLGGDASRSQIPYLKRIVGTQSTAK